MQKSPAKSIFWQQLAGAENWAWLLLFIFSLPAFEFHLGSTVDASIRLMQNLNFAQDSAALFNSHIPQGPLAFLQYPLPIGHNLSIALIFYAIIKLGILIFLRKQATDTAQAMLVYIAIYLFIAPRFMPLALLVLLLFHKGDGSALSFSSLASVALVLVLLYTRLSVGILAVALYLVNAVFANSRQGFALKDSSIRILLAALMILLFLMPYIFYSTSAVILPRFWEILNLNADYQSQLFSSGFFVAVALLLVLAFMLFGTITIGPLKKLDLRPHQKALASVLVLYALLYFRSRPDAGTYYVVLNWVLIFFIALQVLPPKHLWKHAVIWLAAALLIGEAFLAHGSFKTTELRIGAFFSQTFKPAAYRQKFYQDNFKNTSLLPAGASYLVLDESLANWLFKDNLLRSSPSYISSLTENSFLDSLNAVYFESTAAPLFVLSQDTLEKALPKSPKTFAIINRYYELSRSVNGVFVYRRKD